MKKPVVLSWTLHAQQKMRFYKLSQGRVRSVLNSPKRIEEGVAPKTVAMMQPASITSGSMRRGATGQEKWSHEIWVMVQDAGTKRKVISAWRYPGVTKPRGAIAADMMSKEYQEFATGRAA